MSDNDRRFGVPEGEHTYTEQVIRFHYQDGTIQDSEPRLIGPPPQSTAALIQAGLERFQPISLRPSRGEVRRQVLTRVVTTIATSWVAEDVIPDTEGDQ